jgi:hypothetical protein
MILFGIASEVNKLDLPRSGGLLHEGRWMVCLISEVIVANSGR